MKRVIRYIRQHLYLRLGLEILLILASVFAVSLSILFYYSKKHIMDHIEKITADMEILVQNHLQPDSLLAYSRLMLEKNPDVLGFTIALEPDFFPEYGRHFSAYSLRQGDSIATVVEKYDYFNQIWYKKAWIEKRHLWLEPYIESAYSAPICC